MHQFCGAFLAKLMRRSLYVLRKGKTGRIWVDATRFVNSTELY